MKIAHRNFRVGVVALPQVTIISIAIMNIWKLFKPPYNISTVGVVRFAKCLSPCMK